jgi:hypothetical protein
VVEDLNMDKLRTVAQEARDLYGGHTSGWKAEF